MFLQLLLMEILILNFPSY